MSLNQKKKRKNSRCETRRRFIQRAATASSVAYIGGFSRARAAIPHAVIEGTRIISWQAERYHGWPTVARRSDGELLLAYSGRQEHVCPFGRLELMRSKDDGQTWSWPQVIYDGPIDDRDGGIMETARGSLLITTFTHSGWEIKLNNAEKKSSNESITWDPAKLIRWRAVRDRVSPTQRRDELGCFMLRSTDGGITWSNRYRVPLNSPHGPIQLHDGRLIFPGIARWTPEQKMGVCQSTNDGVTWEWLADIADRPGDRRFQSEFHFNYLELTVVECDNGKLVCQLRNRGNLNDGETLQTESWNGGRTWSPIHSINVWGTPSHLMRLRNGRLLMTYGHRRPPFGNQARVSRDNGNTWSEAIILSGDGAGIDVGYPSTVQLNDGSLLTVWYELSKGSFRAQLRQARWELH